LSEPTCSRRDAASVVFNLPGYRVVEAVDLPCGGRRVRVQADAVEDGCPGCGVLSARVHSWTQQRVRDIPSGGNVVEVVVCKPRLVCAESACARKTFTPVTEQLPARARCLTRLREAVLDAVIGSGRAVDEVAAAYGLAWWTVQATVNTAAVVLPQVDDLHVRHLGIDEHRFRRVRFFRDEHGAWTRVEPWMTTFVNARSGQVLGVVDGRDSVSVQAWLGARSPAWRDRVEVVAIDPSASFRKAIAAALPNARVSVDPFHLVQLANLMVTGVRQRVAREQLGRRGRKQDLAWAHRLLLLRAGDRLSQPALARLDDVLRRDDPTDELGAAWGVKEQLRRILACQTVQAAREERMRLGCYVLTADLPEATRLWDTITSWWTELETLIDTRVTNARTEAANTTIKQIKRTGRGYRNPQHYQARILLHSARRTRRRRHLTQHGTTLNCG
jgi:transposase